MAKLDAVISYMMLERAPASENDIGEPRVAPPMSDGVSLQAGNVLVGWGQMMDSMLRYTKCLIKYNNSEPIGPRFLEFPRLKTRFETEIKSIFPDDSVPRKVAVDAIVRSNRALSVRNALAHDGLSWGSKDGCPVIVARLRGRQKKYYNLETLTARSIDIEVAHGRIMQLLLKTNNVIPCSRGELGVLRSIASNLDHPQL